MANWKDRFLEVEDAVERLDLIRSTLSFILEGLESDKNGPLQADRIDEYINAVSLVYTSMYDTVAAAQLAIGRVYEANQAAKPQTAKKGSI